MLLLTPAGRGHEMDTRWSTPTDEEILQFAMVHYPAAALTNVPARSEAVREFVHGSASKPLVGKQGNMPAVVLLFNDDAARTKRASFVLRHAARKFQRHMRVGYVDTLARAAQNPFASRSVQRAHLTPQAHPGSLYRCSKNT